LGRSFAVNRLLAHANPHHTSRTHPVAKQQIFLGVLFFLKTDLCAMSLHPLHALA
jgi:hypothetical protein